MAGHGCRNTPKVIYDLLAAKFYYLFQPCTLHRTPDEQPWIHALHLRTTFLVGEIIPLFVPTLGDSHAANSRVSYLHFLANCTTSCLRANTSLILIFNAFLINEKLEILQPLPEFTRNFLFRVKHQPGEYIPSVPVTGVPGAMSTPQAGTLPVLAQAGPSTSGPSVSVDPEPTYTYQSPPYAPASPTTLYYGAQADGAQADNPANSSHELHLVSPPNVPSAIPRRASKRKASSRASKRLTDNFTS